MRPIIDIPTFLKERTGLDVSPEMILGYQYFIGYEIKDADSGNKHNYYELEEKLVEDKLATFPMRIPLSVSIPRNDESPYVMKERGYLVEVMDKALENHLWKEQMQMITLHWARIDLYIVLNDSLQVFVIEEDDIGNVVAVNEASLARLRLLLSMVIERRKQLQMPQLPPSHKYYVRVMARYFFALGLARENWNKGIEITIPLNEQECESLIMAMLSSEGSGLSKYESRAEEVLKENYGAQELGARVVLLELAPGEYGRIRGGLRFLRKEDVQKMLSVIKAKGEDVSAEELFEGLEECCLREEVWTRETGHLWKNYTLLERTPSQEERDFADTWKINPVKLTSFPVKTIIKMLKNEVVFLERKENNQ